MNGEAMEDCAWLQKELPTKLDMLRLQEKPLTTEKIASTVALTRWKTEVIEGKIETRKNFGYKVAKVPQTVHCY